MSEDIEFDKDQRGIIPRKIKGFRDVDESLNQLRWQVIDSATKVYKSYGFEHLDTPVLEYADCLGKYLPDKETVDEGVYSFRNPEEEPVLGKDGEGLRDKWGRVVMENQFVSLRYDLTAPLARVYAERLWKAYLQGQVQQGKAALFRRYQFGPVFRFEKKIEAGRFRQFWQLDFDSVGTNNITTDAEVCMILSDAMEGIGLTRGDYLVHVNNRKVLKGFLASAGVKDEATEGAVLRVLDKVDKIGVENMILELGEGRVDAGSGAKVEGLSLHNREGVDYDRLVKAVADFYNKFDGSQSRAEVLNGLGSFTDMNEIFDEGLSELSKIDNVLNGLGFDEKRVAFSPTLVRGLGYYTGPVFEVESLQQVKDEKGKLKKFGSISGGGRYDGLVERLLGIKVPATGASIGVDRLCELLQYNESLKQSARGPVLIINFGDEYMGQYQKVARELRTEGIDTEIYMGDHRGIRKQMTYADKRNAPATILIGEDEIKNNSATVKDLKLGQSLVDIKNKEEWQSKAQKEVSLDNIVSHIREQIIK